MTGTGELQTDVIIAGAGPVGAALGVLLAQLGVRVVLADRAPAIYALPRAAHLDFEAIRILQAMGLAAPVLAASRRCARYDFLSASRELLMRFDTGGTQDGWPVSNMIHQPSVEALLRARLAQCETAVLHTGWELTAFTQSESGVQASFATNTGERHVRAHYLVGCDGASSTVRGLSGIAVEDMHFDEPWLVIDTLVHDPQRLPPINLQICDPARPTTCVLMSPGRHRWEFMLRPGETAEMALAEDFIANLLAPWDVAGAVSLERKAVYRFHALIARDWRGGRVLLAGDAAHQTPPFAGQGLCAGLRDAANLAWKLAAVINAHAGEALLDSYTSERRPHVRAVIDLALMMGRMVCIQDPDAAAVRDAALLAQIAAGEAAPPPPVASLGAGCLLPDSPGAGRLFPQTVAEGRYFDDAAGPGGWLISTQPMPAAPGLRMIDLTAQEWRGFAPEISTWLAAQRADAVLVRPDRYVFGTGNAASLAAAWRAALL